jgi:hypothetical protein
LFAERAGLARVHHDHRYPPPGQHRGDLRRPDLVTTAAGVLEREHPLAQAGHHRRTAPRHPAAARGAAGHHPVPVEMHHMKRLAARHRRCERLLQRIKRRGTQNGQVHLAADRIQPLQQRPGHHLIPHILRPGRAGDHHQHPQPPPGNLQRPSAVGDRQAPRHPARPQRDRTAAVAHQLPRQPEQARIGRPEQHLQAPVPRPLIREPRRASAEHRPEYQVAPRGQPGLDCRAAVFPYPERRQQVVLQIPAQILERVGIQRPR